MTTPNQGVGEFTTENIVAVFRAVPESNGTYADVARVAEDYDGDVRSHTIRNWVQAGKADTRNGNNATAYARFAKIYADRLKEHCNAETNRSRELDLALEVLARTCACGNPKMLLKVGTLAERCRVCRELEATPAADGAGRLQFRSADQRPRRSPCCSRRSQGRLRRQPWHRPFDGPFHGATPRKWSSNSAGRSSGR